MTQLRIQTSLNGICPYFTMFPLDFPYRILEKRAKKDQWVIDPFCGRGTTNYACRVLGLPSIGVDSSPVAVALSRAKLACTTPQKIVTSAESILEEVPIANNIPEGEFWSWAYHPNVLQTLCRLREGLLRNSDSDARVALNAIILGALHGPRNKVTPSYFSNQSPRTYAPKPNYAVRYWKEKQLEPQAIDVLSIIKVRAERYYTEEYSKPIGMVVLGDSRSTELFDTLNHRVNWVITSPPYYGMRTYLPDQWLRLWFLGGSSTVEYANTNQLDHCSAKAFITQLNLVWRNVGRIACPHARMVIRFGGINDRNAEPMDILKESIAGTGWRIDAIRSAGSSDNGKRQALHMGYDKQPKLEHDLWATWQT